MQSQICSFRSNSLLFTQNQYSLHQIELSETKLQATIKLEETSEQRYKIVLKSDFLFVHSLGYEQSEHLACLSLNFHLRMSRIYKENEISNKAAAQLQGIRLQNQKGQSASFYFKYSNQAYIWINTLSLFVNQTGFQRLYKPIRKLGKGASAAVYEVCRIQDSRKFAAKVFSKERMSQKQQLLQRLKKEVEILQVLSYQNIIKFQGVFQDQHAYYAVMELVRGMSIYNFLLAQKTKLEKDEIRLIMRNIIKNIQALEELDIIHRDIKLENIIIDSVTLKTKIIDYGLAIYADDEYVNLKCGTPGYLSPQIISNGKEKITSKSDIFSAGIIFHVLLTGKYLFTAENPRQMLANNVQMKFDLTQLESMEIDTEAIQLIKNMLALSPNDRFSASQCLSHEFLREESIEDDQKPNTPSTVGDQQNYHF